MGIKGLVKDFLSCIWGVKEEVRPSSQSGSLEVWYINKRYVLHTAHTNYSFDTLHRIFQNALGHIHFNKDKKSDILLLGGGAGSVPFILEKEMKINARITAVENDPNVLHLKNKYFSPEQLQNTTWIQDDAYHYMTSKNTTCYDVIVIDLFHDDEVPGKFTSYNFLEACRNALEEDGILLFNFMTTDKEKRSKYEIIKAYWSKQEGNLSELSLQNTNSVLVWQKISSAEFQRS